MMERSFKFISLVATFVLGVLVAIIFTVPRKVNQYEVDKRVLRDSIKVEASAIGRLQTQIDSLDRKRLQYEDLISQLKQQTINIDKQRKSRYEEAKKVPVHSLRDSIIAWANRSEE